MIECAVCKGSGITIRVHIPALSIKFKVEILWPCTYCKGRGYREEGKIFEWRSANEKNPAS